MTEPERITPELIEQHITSEHYFNGADAALGDKAFAPENDTSPLQRLTFCVLVLTGGYLVTGESFYSAGHDSVEAAERASARRDALSKAWIQLKHEIRTTRASGGI
jgi:hypothetical protein